MWGSYRPTTPPFKGALVWRREKGGEAKKREDEREKVKGKKCYSYGPAGHCSRR